MGVTEVQARIIGRTETREHTFMVDTSATYLGLPPEEIEALGLEKRRGKIHIATMTGVVEVPTYVVDGELMNVDFTAIMIPATSPLLGYELLENLRFKVNPVTRQIEKVPDGERHPPYG